MPKNILKYLGGTVLALGFSLVFFTQPAKAMPGSLTQWLDACTSPGSCSTWTYGSTSGLSVPQGGWVSIRMHNRWVTSPGQLPLYQDGFTVSDIIMDWGYTCPTGLSCYMLPYYAQGTTPWTVNGKNYNYLAWDSVSNFDYVPVVTFNTAANTPPGTYRVYFTVFENPSITPPAAMPPNSGCQFPAPGCLGPVENYVDITVTSPATNGVCGTANGKNYPAGSTAYTPDTQCAAGLSSNTAFPAPGASVSWVCKGTGGGSDSGTCTASQSPPAQCVNITAPDTVTVGQAFSASVTMKNTNNTFWYNNTEAAFKNSVAWYFPNDPYRLGSWTPNDNTTWGLTRVDMPMKSIGISGRYLRIRTPSDTSWVAWREITLYDSNGNRVTPVNATVSSDWRGANYAVGPTGVYDGQGWTVWNSGTYSGWIILDYGKVVDFAALWLLPEQTPNPPNTTHYIEVSNDNVNYSQIATVNAQNLRSDVWYIVDSYGKNNNNETFNFNATAPTTPGTYAFNWNMVHDSVAWFPDASACKKNITVVAAPSPDLGVNPTALSFSGVSGGATPAGQNVTVKNNTPNTTLKWKATTDQNWCFFDGKSNGQYYNGSESTTAGSVHTITVSAPSNVGTFTCNITVSDDSSSPPATGAPKVITVTYTVTAPVVNGACGTANGKAYPNGTVSYSPDTQCSSGTSTNTAFPAAGSTVTWACNGANGGINSGTCSASQSSAAVNGACGTANGKTYPNGTVGYSPDTQCASGSSSNTTFPSAGSSVSWICQGQNGGSNSAACSASQAAPVVNGVCGTANGKTYPASTTAYSPDTQCTSGTSTNTAFPAAGTTATWVCNGANGGTNSTACSASRASATFPTISLTPNTFSFSGVSGASTPPGQSLTIKNTGNATLNWTASNVPGKPGTWCHISPASGTLAANASVTATVSVDSPSNVGTFSDCGIRISDPAATNNPQDVSITYTVTANMVPPTNLGGVNSGAGLSCGQIKVTWTDNAVGETGFKVYRNTANDPASAALIATVPSTSSMTTGTSYSYTDTPPAYNVAYYYWVTAYVGSVESARASGATGSVNNTSCEANLNTSDKDIASVNGVTNPTNACQNNGEFPTNVQFKAGDTLGFKINLCNSAPASGGKDASTITIDDTLYNLARYDSTKALTDPAAWNASITGGLSIASITPSGTEPDNLTLHITLSGTLAPNSAATLNFFAKVAFPSNFSGTSSRFQNSASISYIKDGATTTATVPGKSTPLLLFVKSQAPTKVETSP